MKRDRINKPHRQLIPSLSLPATPRYTATNA